MILFLIKIIIVVLTALLTTLVSKYFGVSGTYTAVVVAVVTLLSVELTERIALILSNPKVEVFISKDRKGELVIKVSKRKRVVADNVNIQVDTLGPVSNIHDLNDKTGFTDVEKTALGYPTGLSRNTVSIVLKDVSADKLEYKILYEPVLENVEITGLDRYAYSYTWTFRGDRHEKNITKSLSDNKIANPSSVRVKGFTFKPKALTDEEASKDYKEGLPLRRFD